MDIQEIRINIERLRSELTMEYEKCIDKGEINAKVINLSQRLDKLILEFVKLTTPEYNNLSTNIKDEIA